MSQIEKASKSNMLRRLTSYTSIGVAFSLIAVKLGAYLTTGSVALLSSLVDSSIDLIASVLTAYGVIVAMRPPDREHRFGHGKAESLASLAQAVFIVLSAGGLLYKALERFSQPAPIENPDVGYSVMAFALVLTVMLVALQTYTIRKTKSLAIAADRLHYVGDIFVNAAVMATFALQSSFGVLWLDPLFAVVIALILAVGAYKIAKSSLHVLMDAELAPKEREKIIDLMASVSGVKGVHDVRTRESSGHIIVEAHIEMDPSLTLLDAHDITESIEEKLLATYKNADVILHQDPFGHKEKRLDTLIDKIDPA